ncbi:hypothetical protein GCM10009838_51200 [Catenulispora subtropica]|uniref:Uncharacterized protein n=2 Tax=Catenulispora subtropica TaxID=450798 RepID=A0ABP5DP99_9ACTN
MFLGAYHFDGDPAALLPAYDKLLAAYAGDVDLHVCVVRGDGITVFDACPSAEQFRAFSGGADFAAALAGAGLPAPRTEEVGDVHVARLREEATTS